MMLGLAVHRMSALSLFLIWLLAGGSDGQVTSTNSSTLQGACVNVNLEVETANTVKGICAPCEPEKWFEMILQQRAETDANETKCFNSFPLGTHLPFTCPVDLTRGYPHPELDLSKTPRGFIISKLPFFRYNLQPKAAATCNECPDYCVNATVTGNNTMANISVAENLDIGHTKRYFSHQTASWGHNGVDFQILEWPGRTTLEQKQFLQDKLHHECSDAERHRSHRPNICALIDEANKNRIPGQPPKIVNLDFQMLKFERSSSKMLQYPCNREEGTQIVALGHMAVYNESDDDSRQHDPHSKLFLSYGNSSIFNTHGHPLYVAETTLNLMARNGTMLPRGICRTAREEATDCDFTKVLPDSLPATASDCDWRQQFFQARGDIIMHKDRCNTVSSDPTCSKCPKVSKALSGDLRTVLDFTFVQERLILGMRCGILIVSDFVKKGLNIRASFLTSSRGHNQNSFPPINKISSSFCCKKEGCRRTIIAAYSSYANRAADSAKELFISFDLGETFVVKLLAEPKSALNLIWGMYKMYGEWLLYHQLLETPDLEDLKNDRGEELHPGYIALRSVPDWDSLTLAKKEQRFLFGETTSKAHMEEFEVKKRAKRRYVRLRTSGALGRFVRYRRQGKEIELDLAPGWLKREIGKIRKSGKVKWRNGWTDANCDSIPNCRNNFKNDPAVAYYLNQSNVIIKTPRRAPDNVFCDQIMSLAVLQEEDSLYVLCRVGFGDFSHPPKPNSTSPVSCSSRQGEKNCTFPIIGTQGQPSTVYPYNDCVNPIKYYAIYSFSILEKMPIVIIEERRSERLFTCQTIRTALDYEGCKNIDGQPELMRVPGSISLLIKNCRNVLYHSPNGGRTVFHTQFYAHHSQFAGDSTTSTAGNCSQTSNCDVGAAPNTTTYKRQLMYRIKPLEVPPLIAISLNNQFVFMTMRNYYGYGILGINKEFRIIIGEIFPNVTDNIISLIRTNDFVFPMFTYSGSPIFGVALRLIYSNNQVIACQLYQNRHGIRLVRMRFFFYKDVAFYYTENQDFDPEARYSGLAVSTCHTYSFSAKPEFLVLDVDEGDTVEVTVFDPVTNIHLGLVSSEEKSILVDVSLVDRARKEKEHLSHAWDIHINAIRNYKHRTIALIHSFFGAGNSNLYGYSTEVGLANNVDFRCLVQPSASVSIRIECGKKRMVVHEEEHRPQCSLGTFSKSAFEYRLKKGAFDPNLAGYWIELNDEEGKQNIKLDRETGDLIIIYDYLRFGCPLEPYKDDSWIPKLVIANAETNYNSSLGAQYNGSFLLIDLFGSTGYTFSRTFRDYGCTHIPMNLTNMTIDWVHRNRMFKIAYGKQTSLSDFTLINNAQKSEDLDNLEYGNQLFIPNAVSHPINIVNRVTYRDCKKWRSFFLQTENLTYGKLDDLSESERNAYLDQPLPIQEHPEAHRLFAADYLDNYITWSKRSQQVYIFMALALDPTESLCEYFTIFGVHLPEVAEVDSLITLLVFLLLTLIWIMLFICGYMCRKSRIRTLCIQLERKHRLEEGAWRVVHQYEKLLQEYENKQIEQEFREFAENPNPPPAPEPPKRGRSRKSSRRKTIEK